MPFAYSTAVKNARMNAIVSAVDAQTAAGSVEICTTGYASVLVTIPLQKPSATVANGVLTIAGTPITATVANSGTAALARVKDGSGTVVISDITVGTSGANITVPSTSLVANQQFTLNSLTDTHA